MVEGRQEVKIEKPKVIFPPPRIVLSTVEGWGKSTCGAYSTNPIMIMAGTETGYLTLLGAGLVPLVPCGLATEWPDLLSTIQRLGKKEAPTYGVLVLDALSGVERICHEYVCKRDFKGDWGERGFTSYQKGFDVAVTDWIQLLVALDQVRTKGTTILLLAHVQVRPFKNPLGADYDRYVVDVHHKTWGVTHKWADAVLFGTFTGEIDLKTGKAVGGSDRVFYTERRESYDAKNRYGMDQKVKVPNDPTKVWDTVWGAVTKHKGDK